MVAILLVYILQKESSSTKAAYLLKIYCPTHNFRTLYYVGIALLQSLCIYHVIDCMNLKIMRLRWPPMTCSNQIL
jgi:hypothetical protein